MDVTEDEVRHAADELAGQERQRQRRTQWTRGVRRALIIVCVFFVFQQITGINVPFYYGPTLLSTFFQSGHNAVNAAVAGVEVTAILGAVNVVATYFAFRWIDKVGRRPLAIFGYLGMTVFILLAAAGVAFLTDIPKTVVVMVGFSFFITSFAIGVGGTGWLIQGEVFPTAVRGRAAAIAACVDWLANYALIEAFPVWHNAIGLGWVMVCFAVLCVVAIGFVYRFLPETKGLSVEQAVHVFEREAGQSDATGSHLTGPPTSARARPEKSTVARIGPSTPRTPQVLGGSRCTSSEVDGRLAPRCGWQPDSPPAPHPGGSTPGAAPGQRPAP